MKLVYRFDMFIILSKSITIISVYKTTLFDQQYFQEKKYPMKYLYALEKEPLATKIHSIKIKNKEAI